MYIIYNTKSCQDFSALGIQTKEEDCELFKCLMMVLLRNIIVWLNGMSFDICLH